MATAKTTTKAFKVLSAAKSVKERAEQYSKRLKKSVADTALEPLIQKIDKINDKLFDLNDFNLDTDLNKGRTRMTFEDCEKRFVDILELTSERDLIQLELNSKLKVYEEYFGQYDQ